MLYFIVTIKSIIANGSAIEILIRTDTYQELKDIIDKTIPDVDFPIDVSIKECSQWEYQYELINREQS